MLHVQVFYRVRQSINQSINRSINLLMSCLGGEVALWPGASVSTRQIKNGIPFEGLTGTFGLVGVGELTFLP